MMTLTDRLCSWAPRMAAAGLVAGLWMMAARPAAAHLIGDADHDHGRPRYDYSIKPPSFSPDAFQGPVRVSLPRLAFANLPAAPAASGEPADFLTSIFQPFTPQVKTRSDAEFLYVESNSLPSHRMMVGITAWQQQVPLPQPYTGVNAWRLPLRPVPARNPLSARDHFFRGAIAMAANGVPIFNPIKNDGRTDTFLAGELDEFGGHCGRADDYHYHIAPTHLQAAAGPGRPIAVALDGYAIYGFMEPGGGDPGKLDPFNGHTTAALGYHYHSTRAYPYLNGGFHGEVVERDGQVDPQPQAGGVRPALPPLRGAKITGFTSQENRTFRLTYQLGAETRHVNYVVNSDGSVKFDFVDGSGAVRSETYSPRRRGPGGMDAPRPPRRPDDNPERNGPRAGENPRGGAPPAPVPGRGGIPEAQGAAPLTFTPKRSGHFVLTSPAVRDGEALPLEFTGDGEGVTPPLEWRGAPPGTRSYALVMDHLAPENLWKSYWVMWDLPPDLTRLPKNVKAVGKVGATSQRGRSYVPPHSQGPGKKTYTITLYALSAPPTLDAVAGEVSRERLLAAIKELVLDSAELRVTYTRPGSR